MRPKYNLTIATAAAISLLSLCNIAAADSDATSIGGKTYVDFSNIDKTQNGTKVDPSGFGVDVKRFYFVVDHKFDDTWSADLTTDFNYVSGDGETQVFVKKAYIQAKLNKSTALRGGSADMPWIPFVEGIYDYRYVEGTLNDRQHVANSADWGLHLKGGNSMFNYQVSAVNGGGYKHPNQRSKGMDFEGRVAIQPNEHITLALGGYSGHLGKDTQALAAEHAASRYNLLAGYVTQSFRIGAEYFSADNWKNVTTAETDSETGFSVFSSVSVGGSGAVFARYDKTDLSKDLDPNAENKYFHVGYSFKPTKGLDVAFVYKDDKTDVTGSETKTREIGIFTQAKF